MKKLSKLAVFAIAAVTACSAMAFAACGGNDDDKKDSGALMDNWDAIMNFDVENIDSYTLVQHSYPTYPKEEAAEYGEYNDYKSTVKVNKTAEIYYETYTNSYYAPDSEDAINGFITQTSTYYYLKYNQAYYQVSVSDNETYVYEINKDEVTYQINNMRNDGMIDSLQLLNYYKSFFKYNESTGWYEFSASAGGYTSNTYLKGDENAVDAKFEFPENQIISEATFSGRNSTTVSIPQSVTQAIDKYISENN